MEQISVDIINIAGLLRTDGHNGIERAFLERFEPRSFTTIAPTPPWLAAENPERSIERAIAMVDEIIAKLDSPEGILFGHSYGAFVALLVACRKQFRNNLKIILDEGPLHPDVSVSPPPLFPPLALCAQHYRERPRLAREAISALHELGTSKILLIQGTREDSVVPNASQALPGDFQTLQLQNGDDTSWLEAKDSSRGIILQLPRDIGGVQGKLHPLPDSYRTHLLWSREKMDAITTIVAAQARECARFKLAQAA